MSARGLGLRGARRIPNRSSAFDLSRNEWRCPENMFDSCRRTKTNGSLTLPFCGMFPSFDLFFSLAPNRHDDRGHRDADHRQEREHEEGEPPRKFVRFVQAASDAERRDDEE